MNTEESNYNSDISLEERLEECGLTTLETR